MEQWVLYDGLFTYVIFMVSFDNIDKKKLGKIRRYGFKPEDPKKHEEKRFSGPCHVVLYKTGKLLLQGNADAIARTEKILKYLGITSESRFSGPAIGTDESLKGDTFGGIVVCGFFADDQIRNDLNALGVRDSKTLNNAEITELAKKIITKYPKHYHVEDIFPKDYNKYILKKNTTGLLNELHGKCYRKLAGRKEVIHIIDKYPGCNIGDIVETKAESKYLEVAAASVIARYFALKQIHTLEQRAGLFIPLGSSKVESALIQLRKKSLSPENFVKLNFKNVKKMFK